MCLNSIHIKVAEENAVKVLSCLVFEWKQTVHTLVTVTQHPGTGPAAPTSLPFCCGLIPARAGFAVQLTAKAEESKCSGDPRSPHVHSWALSQAKQ